MAPDRALPSGEDVAQWLQAHYDAPLRHATARDLELTLLSGGVTSNVNIKLSLRAADQPAAAPQHYLLKICAEKTGAELDAWVPAGPAPHARNRESTHADCHRSRPMLVQHAQLAGMEVLRQHQFPTAYVVADRSGRAAAPALPDGRQAVLFDFLEGRAPDRADLTDEMVADLGRALAALHAVPVPTAALPHAAQGGCATYCLLPDLLATLDARGDPEDRAMASLLREVRRRRARIHPAQLGRLR